jgi:hypothetical protein
MEESGVVAMGGWWVGEHESSNFGAVVEVETSGAASQTAGEIG